ANGNVCMKTDRTRCTADQPCKSDATSMCVLTRDLGCGKGGVFCATGQTCADKDNKPCPVGQVCNNDATSKCIMPNDQLCGMGGIFCPHGHICADANRIRCRLGGSCVSNASSRCYALHDLACNSEAKANYCGSGSCRYKDSKRVCARKVFGKCVSHKNQDDWQSCNGRSSCQCR
ncbi:MAG: hypothetical protein C0432_04030, partial [Candidatus Puniceispirillum sp.]|nr:hypothetical protein [Candidatus Pelagibacter sp.]MBA4283444.1 hypothetical protein [Candidatus Puniceispirillum sp.]